MIRFIDLTKEYWTDPSVGFPMCSFLNTTTDRYLENEDGEHTFREVDVANYPDPRIRERLGALTPPGFWHQHLRTKDGTPLAWSRGPDPRTRPVLTVALRLKWYALYVVHVEDTVEEVSFEMLSVTLQKLGVYPPYQDHVPNPRVLRLAAERCGYDLDELAEEIAVGRWRMENQIHCMVCGVEIDVGNADLCAKCAGTHEFVEGVYVERPR